MRVLKRRFGFSVIELVGGGAILCVVAVATLLSIKPIEQSRENRQVQATADYLNELAARYRQDRDAWPTRNGGVWDLAVTGYIDFRQDREEYQRLSQGFEWDESYKAFKPVE